MFSATQEYFDGSVQRFQRALSVPSFAPAAATLGGSAHLVVAGEPNVAAAGPVALLDSSGTPVSFDGGRGALH
jgi:hypothetical protein